MPTRIYTFERETSLRTIRRILDLLEAEGRAVTLRYMAEKLSRTKRHLADYMKHLSEPGDNQKVHLAYWGDSDDGNANQTAYFALGPGVNAPKKKVIPKGNKAYWEKHRKRLKRENPEEYERRRVRQNEMRRVRRLLDKMAKEKASQVVSLETIWHK